MKFSALFAHKLIAAFVVVMLALVALPAKPANAAACTFTSIATGDWNAAGTWSAVGVACGTYPGASFTGDTVVIANGNTVTLNVTPANSIASLQVGQGTSGTLTLGNSNTDRTLTVTGNVTVNSGATFNTAGNGGNTLNIGGNLANAGAFDMNVGGADATVVFNGTANQAISGAGGTTDFDTITINNSGAANNNIVEVTSTNFTVPAGFLTLTDGFFKVSGSFALTNTFFGAAGYTIPAGTGIWINNANTTVTGQNADVTLNGTLRVSAGTYNVGTANGNDLDVGADGAALTIEGGTVNIARRFSSDTGNTTNFTMTGGTLNLGTTGSNTTRSLFDLDDATSTFTMSGGTIIIRVHNAGGLDFRNDSATNTITGGTVQFGNASTPAATTFQIATGAVLPSLAINTTNSPTVRVNGPITVQGNVTIATGTTLNANNQNITVSGNSSAAGNWTNNGTFTQGTGTVIFNGTSAQTIGGSTATIFNNLTINNSNGVTLSVNAAVNGILTFTNGKITTGANRIIIGTAGSVSGAGAGKYIYGNLQKNFATGAQSFTFEIGDSTNYTPVAVSFANISGAGNVTATTTASEHPNIATSGINSSKDVNRYWTLTSGGGLTFTTYNATFNFVAGDIDGGANTSNFIVQRYSAGWTTPTTGTRTATSTQATGLMAMSDFAVGEQPPAATTTTITADSPDPSVTGQSVNVTATVSGGTTPTGTVDITGADVNCTITLSGGTGSCNATFNSTGSKTLTATYNPDSTHLTSSNTEPHTVNAANTSTTITSDLPDPSVVGESVIVNYSVTVAAPGAGTPTGNMTVSDGTDSCTGTVAAGTCSITFSSAGSKTLTATYAGDSDFNGSTSATAGHTVNAADTTTTITSDIPDPSVVGEAVAINYTVTVDTPGSGTPTGNVTVSDGTDSCTGTVAAGSCSITFTSAGAKSLIATYAGDSNFNGSASTIESHAVNQADTTTTITSDSPDPSVVGESVTVNYSVTVTALGSGTPTGNVTVSDGIDSCTGTVAAGTCSITFTSSGSKSLTATYSGDSDFNGSISAIESHTVNAADTTTIITSDLPDPSVVGESVTVNYSVTVNVPGSGAPTGNVTVSDGTDSCTGTVAAGTCSITFSSAGSKSLTAIYAGDSDFNGSASAIESHNVNAADTTTSITNDSPDPSVVGESVTINYSVTVNAPGSGTPTGNVTVSDGVQSCTGTVAAGTCSITFTTAGVKSLAATYSGDSDFGGNTSASESHTVNGADTTTIITSDLPDPSLSGQSVTVNFTVTVNAPGSGTPSGNVTISDGVDNCTGTVAAGTCSIMLNTGGIRTLTATYAGDADFNSSTSAGESHTVNEGPAITSADNTTFTVSSAGNFTVTTSGYPAPSIVQSGTLPSGVTFTDNGDGTATLSGTPATGTAGAYPLTFTASNGIGSDASQNFTLNVVGGPTVAANGVNTTPDTGNGRLDENEAATVGITSFTVKFSKDVKDPAGDSDPEDVTNPANYMLLNDNGNGFTETDCTLRAQGGDFEITVDSVTYNNATFVATINVNNGLPLANGRYRLYVCGTTSITDLGGLKLAGDGVNEGTDFIRNFRVQISDGGGGGGGGNNNNGNGALPITGGLIPVTGFAPNRVTLLPPQPKEDAYSLFSGLRIEIPVLGVNIPIVGVNRKNNGWDLTWLGNNAGYLEGSAYPTWVGNTVLTGHLVNADGSPGPFAHIKDLQIGDQIRIRFGGQIFIYEVRENTKVIPTALAAVFKHETYSWLTLVTCEDYNKTSKTYDSRRMVRAVLISVIPAK